ncbi:MAG: hypothetical protein ACOCRX_06380 [Candidatus Woesearchaeota archaeon]
MNLKLILFGFVFLLITGSLYAIEIDFLSGKDLVTFHSYNRKEDKVVKICPLNVIEGVAIDCHNQDEFLELNPTFFGECGLVSLPDICNDYDLIIDYSEKNQTNRIREEIRVIRTKYVPEDILTRIEWDSSFGTDLDTVYSISTLLEFNHQNDYSEEILNSLNWLNSKRNDEEKCFPKDDCKIKRSLLIGSWLKKYDLNKFLIRNNLPESKLLHDLTLWSNSMNNYAEDSKYELVLESRGITNCSIDLKSENQQISGETIQFENSFKEEIRAEFGSVNISCEDNIDFFIYSEDKIIRYKTDVDHFNFKFSSGCWAEDKKWNECDIKSTIYGHFLTDEPDLEKKAFDFLKKEISGDSYFGDYLVGIEETSLYNLFVENNNRFIRWLKYNQNNDGSWGNNSEKYYLTPLVLLSIYSTEKNRNDESIEDGIHWISRNYQEYENRDNINEFSLLNIALMRLSPLTLSTDEKIFSSNTSEVTIVVKNPTLSEVNGSIETEEYFNTTKKFSIEPQSQKKININLISNVSVKDYFSLVGFHLEDYSFSIPFILNLTPSISFDTKELDVREKTYNKQVRINKTYGQFECIFQKDDKTLEKTFNEDNKFNIGGEIDVETEDRTTLINDEINYTCYSEDNSKFQGSFDNVVRYVPENPFDVSKNKINITKQHEGISLKVKNNLDEVLTIKGEFLTKDPYIRLIYEEFQVPALGEFELDFLETYPKDEELNWTNKLVLSSFNYEEEVLFNLTVEESSSFLSIFLKIFLFWVIVILIFFYRNRIKSFIKGNDFNFKEFNLKQIKGLFSKSKSKFNPKKEKDIIDNMVHMINLMNDMGKNKQQIIYQLEDKGFEEGEIDYAIKKSNFSRVDKTSNKKEDTEENN